MISLRRMDRVGTMAKTLCHAFDYLQSADPKVPPPVVALVGPDRFLKRQILERLTGDEDDASTRDGSATPWSEVHDELSYVSLFGTGPRRVILTDADSFISENREKLEKYVERPLASGVLILDAASLPSNTRLYKAIQQQGLIVACRLPEAERGRGIDTARVRKWLESWAKSRHRIRLTPSALDELADLLGWELGLLDQELAKLALFVQPNDSVDGDLVRQIVGGWRTETTWEMLDAVASGHAAEALKMLDQLLQAGEAPQALFGSMAWSLRRFAAATRIYQRMEQEGRRVDLGTALAQAGFRTKPPFLLKQAEEQLRQIGRSRAHHLYQWLLETDLALKGTHASAHRGRIALEKLILRLARQPVKAIS